MSVTPPPHSSNQNDQPIGGFEAYHTVAETIGGPSLRIKDNIVQALVVFASIGVGAIIGFIGWGGMGALAGGVAGMILGTLISGLVLMVLGWVRAAKVVNKRR